MREVAQVTGLTGPTAHRIIRALHRQGFLEQDPLTDTYHLGYGAALLGRLALERLGFTSPVRSSRSSRARRERR